MGTLESMDETLLKIFCDVVLHDGEQNNICLDDHDIHEGVQENDLSVPIHLHGGKHINLEGFKMAMGKAWKCRSFSMQHRDDKFYQIFFGT